MANLPSLRLRREGGAAKRPPGESAGGQVTVKHGGDNSPGHCFACPALSSTLSERGLFVSLRKST